MPVTQAQLLSGAAYQFETYSTSDPVDQVNTDRPLLKFLLGHKEESVFGNGIYNEMVRVTNDSNYQNFTGDDQLTYKRKNTIRKAPFQHYEAFDGFALNETELADNGVILTDDKNASMTDAEKIQIVNKLKEGWVSLKEGLHENFDIEMHLDGQQSTKAAPGIDLLVSTTPAVGTIGGIDAAGATYWRNNANLNIPTATAGNLVNEMEKTWRACMTYGGKVPDYIVVGSAFYDAYRKDSLASVDRQLVISGRGGPQVDASVSGINFKGVPIVWDPSFDKLDTILGAITYPWTKRAYFLNSKVGPKLRPVRGRWMVKRIPERMYDRHTHYFGMSLDYGLTIKQRNANAVLSIA